MNTGTTILDLCAMVEEKLCWELHCTHPTGDICDGPGCDNRICLAHTHEIEDEKFCRECFEVISEGY